MGMRNVLRPRSGLKLFSTSVMEPAVITVFKKPLRLYKTASFVYAHPDGGPVLKGTPRMWSYLNGLYIQWNYHRIFVLFRRFG